MAQKFDDSLFEDKPFETQEMDDSLFEDTKFEASDAFMPQEQPEKEITKGESALKGAQQGLTFGFADEMGAGIETGLDKTQAFLNRLGLADESPSQFADRMRAEGMTGDLGPGEEDLYQDALKKQRESFKEAEEANPNSYLAGEIGAGMLIPGGATAKALSKGGKLMKAAKLGTIGAAGGAAYGAGQAESNEEILDKMIEGGTAGAVANVAVPGAAKVAGKGLKKGAEVIGELPYVENMFKAFQQGLKGNKVTGTKAFEEIGQEAVDKSRKIGGQLDEEGSRLAKKQAEILDESDVSLDLTKDITSLGKKSDDIAPLGRAVKQDKSNIKEFVEDIDKVYGPTEEGSRAIFKQIKEARPDLPDDQIASMVKEYNDLTRFSDISARDAYNVSKRLKEFGGVAKNQGDIPELRTQEARDVVSGVEKNIREGVYDSVEGLRKQNQIIQEFNSAMEELGLSDVNKRFLSAKEKAKVKRKLFDYIKNLGKESDSSIIARDSVKQLDDVLRKTNPELADEIIPELTDVAERLDLAKRSVGSGNMIGSILNLEGYGITGGNVAGRVVGSALPKSSKQSIEVIKSAGNRLKTMSTDDLIDMRNIIGYKYGNRANKLVESLGKMSETTNARQRQAIVFGILQDPESRKMLGINPSEAETDIGE